MNAIRAVFPDAKNVSLTTYENDSVCGTWELLADAIFPGGAVKLSAKGYQEVGAQKAKWAEAIAPNMDVDNNLSPSFCYFRNKLRDLIIQN